MGKKYLDQDSFDRMVASLTRQTLKTRRPPEELYPEVWAPYCRDTLEESIREDALAALETSLSRLKEWGAPLHPEFIRGFELYMENHDIQGKPKEKSLFGEGWFRRSKTNPHRVEDYLKRLAVYCAGLTMISRPRPGS